MDISCLTELLAERRALRPGLRGSSMKCDHCLSKGWHGICGGSTPAQALETCRAALLEWALMPRDGGIPVHARMLPKPSSGPLAERKLDKRYGKTSKRCITGVCVSESPISGISHLPGYAYHGLRTNLDTHHLDEAARLGSTCKHHMM